MINHICTKFTKCYAIASLLSVIKAMDDGYIARIIQTARHLMLEPKHHHSKTLRVLIEMIFWRPPSSMALMQMLNESARCHSQL